MQRMIWIVMILSWLAACRFDSSGIPLPDARIGCSNECVDNGTAYCDENGTVETCLLGCSDFGDFGDFDDFDDFDDFEGAHCLDIVPSNRVNDRHLDGVTTGLIVCGGQVTSIYTDEASIVSEGETIRQPVPNGVDAGMGFYFLSDTLAVLAVSSLSVERDGTLRAAGGRSLIILSAGDVSIDGLIDISGGCLDGDPQCAGPGGGRGATDEEEADGCAPGGPGNEHSNSDIDETGGGGGGLGASGAPGGEGSQDEAGGSGGGSVQADDSSAIIGSCPDKTLVPLVGGSGGGKGGFGGNGGGGGGALQITSKTKIIFAAGGEIWAGGAGGGGAPENSDDGGGGGGSGGAILLEAPEIMAAGAILTANGGGGGGGGTGDGITSGKKGTRTTAQAKGGKGGDNMGDHYRGGAGGSFDGAAQPGAAGGDGTGGGGGGVGIIRINAPAERLDITNAIISPAHTRGDPAAQ